MGKLAEIVDVNSVSRISEGTSVTGEIKSSNDIRIDGKVDGKLYSEGRIVVGEHAVIVGTLLCGNLDLWGKIEGDVYVKDVLSLKGTSSITGNLHVRRLQVEMGAELNGTCKMISEEDFDACLGNLVSKPAQVE
ncbi:MAG: polymer-forming cytoskeletal protein [Bacteroidales bacterium]|nr:polymer-forming cytoskeletal protein [Bacteroidales bacterium]